MADAIVSAAAKRMIALIEKQAGYHVNLVRGCEEKIRSLAVDLQTIRHVLDDAESCRFKNNGINYWLSRLEQTSYEMEDVLDEWEYALLKHQMEERSSKQKVCSFIPSSSCLCFKKVGVRHNIGKKILSVKAKFDDILKERDQFGFVISQPNNVDPLPESWRVQSTSMIDFTKVHGRDTDRDILVSKLVDSGGSQEELGFCVLSIVGVGGLGKTTLAQMVYNHTRVEESYELRIWVCVSDPFDLVGIAKGILESIRGGSSPSTNHLDTLLTQVKMSILGKKFLLVLDDVWTEDTNKWEPLEDTLRCAGVGSKILVTSRSERVVKMMGSREGEIIRPRPLSDDDCWLLLRRMALSGMSEVEFEDIGKKIAKKCKGLPLAVKTLGSLLRFSNSLEQWSKVLNSEIWQIEEAEIDIFPHLILSYNELPSALKRCFSYCARFSKDDTIRVESLIHNWISLGYLGSNISDTELQGRKYFDVLAMRSFFQDFQRDDVGKIKYCKMHDIVHDFAQFLKKRSKVEAIGMKNGINCGVCDPSHISMANEFCTINYYNKPPPKFCDCLARLRVLGFYNCEITPPGMEKLIHLRKLELSRITNISREAVKAICQLYHLQRLSLDSCNIEEIPKEIGNLINLTFLDLSSNEFLKELPSDIGNLIHLRQIYLCGNESLKELPESMCNLQELQILYNGECGSLCRIPQTLLHTVTEFPGGIGGMKLELLKNLNHLNGYPRLRIKLNGEGDLKEVIQDAQKAELRNQIQITSLRIYFRNETDEEVSSSLSWAWMDLLEALQPHPNLIGLSIDGYGGSKFPQWMVSPLNQVRKLSLYKCKHLRSLPPLGKLLCLEEIYLGDLRALEIVGQDFLGIVTGEGGGDAIAFPKLKCLTFSKLPKWKTWLDITVEEESAASSIMPCLTELIIELCFNLIILPHRMLSKVSSLKILEICGSTELERRYGDKDGSDWKSISRNNPDLHLIMQ